MSTKTKDWDHTCPGNGCRFPGCENTVRCTGKPGYHHGAEETGACCSEVSASAVTLPRSLPLQDFTAQQVYEALVALAQACELVHERLYIIQPFLSVYKEHGAVINAVLEHCGENESKRPADAARITRNTAARLRTFCATLLESGLSAERKLGGELEVILRDDEQHDDDADKHVLCAECKALKPGAKLCALCIDNSYPA